MHISQNFFEVKLTKLPSVKENFRELVTIQRRYSRCDIKIVPRLEAAPSVQSDLKRAAPSSEETDAQQVDELKEEEDVEVLEVSSNTVGQPNCNSKTPNNQSKVQNPNLQQCPNTYFWQLIHHSEVQTLW